MPKRTAMRLQRFIEWSKQMTDKRESIREVVIADGVIAGQLCVRSDNGALVVSPIAQSAAAWHSLCQQTMMFRCTRLVWLLALSVFLAIRASPASANVLVPADAENIHNLMDQFFKLAPYNSDAFNAAPMSTKLCLFDLNKPMDVFYNDFKSVHTLTILAVRMVDAGDEQQVLRMLRSETRSFLDALEQAKRGTNFVMGQCAREALAVSLAQQLLQLYDRAGAVVRGMIKKMGANGSL